MVLNDYLYHLTLHIPIGNVYTENEVMHVRSHNADHYKVANQEKALVAGACILTFADRLF